MPRMTKSCCPVLTNPIRELTNSPATNSGTVKGGREGVREGRREGESKGGRKGGGSKELREGRNSGL